MDAIHISVYPFLRPPFERRTLSSSSQSLRDTKTTIKLRRLVLTYTHLVTYTIKDTFRRIAQGFCAPTTRTIKQEDGARADHSPMTLSRTKKPLPSLSTSQSRAWLPP